MLSVNRDIVIVGDLHLVDLEPRTKTSRSYKDPRFSIDDAFSSALQWIQSNSEGPLTLVINGDFIDFDDPMQPIFYGDFQDSGTAFETHVLAGIELPAGRGFNILFEGRYAWVDDELSDDFAGLGKIELGGASFFGGFGWRF